MQLLQMFIFLLGENFEFFIKVNKANIFTHWQVREMTRVEVESELTFAGFVIISCPLKTDSKSVVREIQDASHHVRDRKSVV